MVGVTLVGFITIVASSTTASIESAVDQAFRADYVIDTSKSMEETRKDVLALVRRLRTSVT